MYDTTDVTAFQLDGLTASVSFHDPSNWQDFYMFRILRGAVIAGVPTYVTSSCYWPTHDRHDKRIRTLKGSIFPNQYYEIADAGVSYGTIIDTICSHFDLDYAYEDPAAAWINYQFMAHG